MKQSSTQTQNKLFTQIDELKIKNRFANRVTREKARRALESLMIDEDGITAIEGDYQQWLELIISILGK